jgi:hypothetical protein
MPAIDEEVIRDLLHRYTDHVQPPASIATEVVARQRRRDRRRVMSIAATGAAVGTAAGVIAVVPGHSTPAPRGTTQVIKLTADQRTLYHLSAAASSQSQAHGHGRYAVMKTEGSDLQDTSVIDSRTGNMWSYQLGSHGYPSGKSYTPHYSPTSAQFAAIPTGRASTTWQISSSNGSLRAALIRQWHSEVKAPKPIQSHRKNGPTLVPIPITVSDNDIVFQQASDMLWNPLVSPSLRSALYKLLAAVPGVKVNPSARDSNGRPAVKISRTDDSGFRGGKSDGITYATYENPRTGAVLESTITYPPGDDVTPQDPHATRTHTDTYVYLSIRWMNRVPADPYRG